MAPRWGLPGLWLLAAIALLPLGASAQSAGQLQFGAANYSVNEGDGFVTVTVVRTGGTAASASVQYQTLDGTAVGDVDYQSKSGTLTFAAGEATRAFSILIYDNAVANADKTVFVRLFNPAGATLANPTNAVVTIRDDDAAARPGIFNFDSPAYSVNESGGSALFTVTRSGGSAGAVSVDYATAGGIASPNVDYGSVTGTLFFAFGETEKTFAVTVFEDALAEGDETVTVSLSNPAGGATLGGVASAVLTIVDNDIVSIDLAPGSPDRAFDPGMGADQLVRAVLALPDGKVVVGGAFTRFADTNRPYVARLNPDGSLDQGFGSTNGPSGAVWAAGVAVDGRVVLGGAFTNVNTAPMKYLARLTTNGLPDGSFGQLPGLNAAVNSLVVQNDGRIVIGGGFSLPTAGIVRIRPDGSLDVSFDSGTGANGLVHSVSAHTNGQIVIGGSFSAVNGFPRHRAARLNSNGTVDLSFVPILNTTGIVFAVAAQDDGKVIIAGSFGTTNGPRRARVARLNSDGSLDAGFDAGTIGGSAIYAVVVQPDGKILLGGDFTSINGTSRKRYARVHHDGSLDVAFGPGTGADGTVYSIALMPDGGAVIGGDFTTVNGLPRRGVALLNGDDTFKVRFTSGSYVAGQMWLTISSRPGLRYAFDASSDLLNWTALVTNTASGFTLNYTDNNAGSFARRFYRTRRVDP